jgi:hypothetical protein
LQPGGLFGVEHEVGGFVEEGEPHHIGGLAAQAELDDGLVRVDPLGDAPDAGAGDFRDEQQGDADFGAGSDQVAHG